MKELLRKNPELKNVSADQLLTALQGAGVERVKVEAAVKRLSEQNKTNRRVGRSVETILKF